MDLDKLPHIYQTAIRASIEASATIMSVYRSSFDVELKKDGSQVTEADLKSSEIISKHLEPLGIPITGEERVKTSFDIRSTWEENWSVDPLDGTKMFVMKNDEFSINIAHIQHERPVFGLICSPVEEKIIIGISNRGVYTFHFDQAEEPASWIKIEAKANINKPLTIACSRSFTQSKYPLVAELIEKYGDIRLLRKGSALKFFDLADGTADIYLSYAPTIEWDIAAGQAILSELGGKIKSLETNKELTYNKKSLFNPNFVARTKPILL